MDSCIQKYATPQIRTYYFCSFNKCQCIQLQIRRKIRPRLHSTHSLSLRTIYSCTFMFRKCLPSKHLFVQAAQTKTSISTNHPYSKKYSTRRHNMLSIKRHNAIANRRAYVYEMCVISLEMLDIASHI